MSTTVDERVVSMRFDNKHFESNVSTTMSTLDKLKQKLNLSGASKGLEGLETAAKKVDLSGIGNSAEKVGLKFNAMYTIADQAFRNITNSAMAYGKRIVSAFTIDPIKTGFSEYETQINAVQTILSNTQSKGTTIDDVNQALDELNTYADKTIYNFTEMTKNIGTFTAAGTDLDTSVKAIQGIANLAAVSGSTSQQASTAMYQLSQALASGTVKLMDWNSVVNAGMGGQVFQDALKETARVHGVAIDQMIEEEGSFRETLSNGWLSSEILTETLEKFTMCAEEGTKEWNEYMEALKSKGYTEEQAKEILALGKNATEAATKVKTFTQLWDTLKEAAQSGWTQSWEIIVGDFYEARDLLTGISDFLGNIINNISNWRNTLLEGVLGSSPFQHIKDLLDKAGLGIFDKYAEKVTDLSDKLEYYQDVVTRVWRGDYNAVGMDPDRRDMLADDGYNFKVVQTLVNLGYEHKLTVEDLQEAYKTCGMTAEEAAEATKKMTLNLDELTDEQLRNMGLTDAEIKLLRQLNEVAKKTGKSLGELLEERSKMTGRQMLIDSFKGIAKVLGDVAGVIAKAWEAIFNPEGLSSEDKMKNRIVTLYGALMKFYDFATTLELTDNTADKLSRTFKGLFAVLDLVTTILGGGFKIAFEVISKVLSYFGVGILDVTAFIGDALVAVHDWLFSLVDVTAILDAIVPPIKSVIEWVTKLCKEIGESEEFKEFQENVSEAGEAISKFFKGIGSSEKFASFVTSVQEAAAAFGAWLAGLGEVTGIKNFISFIETAGEKFTKWVSGIESAEDVTKYIVKGIVTGLLSGVNAIWDVLVGLGGYIIDGLSEGISSKGDSIWGVILKIGESIVEAIKEYFGIHSPSTLMMAIGGFIIAGLVVGLQNGMGGLWTTITEMCTGLVNFISNIDFGTALAAALSGGIVIAVNKFADALQSFATPFEGFGDMLEEVGDMCKAFGKGVKNYLNAKAVQSLAISIAILVGSLIALAIFINASDGSNAIWEAVGILGGLTGMIAVLAGVIIGLDALASKNKVDGKGIGNLVLPLLAMAGTILALAVVLKLVSGIENASSGLLTMVGLMSLITAFAMAIGGLGKLGIFDSVDEASTMMLKMASAMLVMMIVIKLAANLSEEEIKSGLVVVGLIGLLFSGIIAASKLAGEHGSSAGGMLLKMSFAMLVMVGVVKLAAGLEDEEVKRGLIFVAAVEGLFTGIIAVSKLAGEHASKAGGMLFKMAIAMGIMIAVIKLAAKIKADELGQAALAITIIGGIFAALIAVTQFAGKHADEAGTMLVKMSVALLILSGVMFILSLFKPEGLAKALGAIVVLTACISALIIATGKAKNGKAMSKTLIELMIVIGLLGAIVIALSFIDTAKVATAAGAMGVLMGVFAALIAVTKYVKNTKDSRKSIVTMLGAVVVLAGVVALLSLIKNPEAAIKASAAIGILMLSLASALVIMGKAGRISTTVSKLMAPILLVVAGLAVILGVLSVVNAEASIPSAIALGVLLNALAAAMVILGTVKTVNKTSVGAMALLALVVGELAIILGLMSHFDVEASMGNALALSTMMAVLTGVLVVLGVLGTYAAGAYVGVGAMALLALVVGELAIVLGLMSYFNIEASMGTVLSLSTLLLTLTGVLAVLTLIGPMATAAYPAMLALAVLIAGMSALLYGLGALMEYVPNAEEFLASGVAVMGQLGQAIGAFVGGIAAGFAGQVLQILPDLGTALSAFMTNLEPFISGLKAVDLNVLAGVGILSAAVIALTAANLISGVAALLQGGSSFAMLGAELSAFMINAMPFILGASLITEDMVSGVKALAETILILTAANVIEGLASWLTGGSSLATFATQLPLLAQGLVGFKTALGEGGLTESDLTTVEMAANAVKVLASAASEIPNSGGWVGAIVGENDLDTFAAKFPKLAQGLVGFKDALGEGGLTEDDLSTVEMAANAVKVLASAASEIPNSGGWVGAIIGENNLDTFAAQFPKLATGLVGFKDAMSDGKFTEDDLSTVEMAANAVKTFSAVASEIPNSGGWVAKLIGDNNLAVFAAGFPTIATGLAGFKTNIGEWTEEDNAMISRIATAITTLATVANKINEDTSIWDALSDDFMNFIKKIPEIGTQLSKFASNLGESFTTDSATIFVRAANAIQTLAGLNIGENAGTNLSTFASKLPGIMANVKSFASEMKNITVDDMTHSNVIVAKLTSLINKIKGMTASSALSTTKTCVHIAKDIRTSAETLGHISGQDLDVGVNAVNTLKDMVSGLVGIDVSGVTALADALEDLASKGIKSFSDTITGADALSVVEGAVSSMIDSAATAVSDNSSTLETAFSDLASSGASAIKTQDNYNSYSSAGSYLASGLAAGIRAGLPKVRAAAAALEAAAETAVRLAAKIKSPSKVFYGLGEFVGLGFTNALYDYVNTSYDAGAAMADSAKYGLGDAISNIQRMLSSDMDVQPTISPVLDLDNIESGVAAMNNMLNVGSSVQVLSNVGAISSMMSRKGQNGGNDDVVSAIDKLRGDLASTRGDTYQINGVTYDDGSNISTAVKTIVRAARIERRS